MNYYNVYDSYGYVGTYSYEEALEVAREIYDSGQSARISLCKIDSETGPETRFKRKTD